MRARRVLAAAAVAAFLLPVTASGALAAPSGTTPATGSVYEIAISAPTASTSSATPQAIPAVVAVGVALARGFTAAKAPQQVSQMLRTGSFLHNFMGGSAHLRSNVPTTSIDVIFDH